MVVDFTDEPILPGMDAFRRERVRQVVEEGYDAEHDARHAPEELLRAGACYLDWAASEFEGADQDSPHPFWPWSEEAWKPDNVQRAMEKGVALVAAAYDVMIEQ